MSMMAILSPFEAEVGDLQGHADIQTPWDG
jgi:hypothetical protein